MNFCIFFFLTQSTVLLLSLRRINSAGENDAHNGTRTHIGQFVKSVRCHIQNAEET